MIQRGGITLADGVQVLSENEMLSQMGDRIHTGKSTDRNRNFAASFTREFSALAAKYPIYAELQNVFDLALTCALLKEHSVPARVGWQMAWFGEPSRYHVPLGAVPRRVDSVINHRLAGEGQIIAGVSGGVRVDARPLAKEDALRSTQAGQLDYQLRQPPPSKRDPSRWWWD